MKVVHVITGLHSGGAERALVDHLTFTRHQTQVITLATEGRMAAEVRALGVTVTCLNMRSNRDLLGLIRLIRILRRLSPDVVHLHLYRSLVFGRVAAWVLRLPVIATEHSAHQASMERRPASRLVKGIYRLSEMLGGDTIAVSPFTREVLIDHWGVPARRVRVIPNGVRTERFHPDLQARRQVRADHGIAEDTPVAVTVGRLSPEKRIDLGLQMLTKDGAESWHLLVIGSGTAQVGLEFLAEELGVTDRVHFTGEQEDVTRFLAAGDVYLQLTDYETYGLSAVEAFSSGLPVVYRSSPALDEIDADPWAIPAKGDEDVVWAHTRQALALGRRELPLPAEVAENVDVRRVAARIDEAEEQAAAKCRLGLRWWDRA